MLCVIEYIMTWFQIKALNINIFATNTLTQSSLGSCKVDLHEQVQNTFIMYHLLCM